MANLVAGQIIELKTFCSHDGQQGINTYHFHISSVTGGNTTDALLAAALDLVAAPPYVAYLPVTAQYEGVRLQIINPLPLPVAQISVAETDPGVQNADPLPNVATILVKKFTAMAGPGGRGRVFLPFWPENLNSVAGEPTPAAITLADAVGTALLTAQVLVIGAVSVSLQPVLWDRANRDWTPVTNHLVRTRWYHQIRRSNSRRPDVIGP